ncbi:MAG TPA: DNA topoisomerase IV subunit B [Bacteroidales bacterium]|nr:DNA topoisomerase IV [Rikenellaceae bacterium]HON54728.1 DNA topoisomerase IV subunit B [Bacteroidales bacterium]HRR49588.1 DNA topoisomerase IV subunit B [Bacteroidales bacterium]HRT34103.1 DNA topoisomerase IV subunit B [Bacteroidales bacterium]HRT83418.1 DNA topoisomerase IV subunit B [Bacteroidales bacterium]
MGTYTEKNIRTLNWNEHIRRRPGMYIGKLGDGSSPDDGIYVLLKEVMDNSIDEFAMGFGKIIYVTIQDKTVSVRDFGRGIPLGSLVDASSKINTGGKYDDEAFKKSVGLNGVGLKAVNALSVSCLVQSFREGESHFAKFSRGELIEEGRITTSEKNGTLVTFLADDELFENFSYNFEFVESMLRNYCYLNTGLTIKFNEKEFFSKNGLLDLLNESLTKEPLYQPIHLKGEDIEIAMTHGNDYGESISSFVNGQYTTQGGTHLAAFREGIAKTLKEFYKRDFDPSDIRQSIIAAISIKVQEPQFEGQTKTKLGSKEMSVNGVSIRNYIIDFLKDNLDNFLHKNPETADTILKKILDSEKERKAISGIQKLARERAKKANLHNKKLRDCRIHYNDKNERAEESTLFITEGDSASGSITKSRDVTTQAVFSLRGKPQNSYGLTKKIVYENEEFNLLQAALNIEADLDNLRYNKIIIATDADVDGMHIRLLLLTFFLQFFPELIRQGHLYILQTPLFRVRNKKETHYCYSIEERDKVMKKLGANIEITRFKGLGEISPDEFREFIGDNIKLERVRLGNDDNIPQLLEFYMGKNTPDRQSFIRSHLRQEVIINEL